MLLKGKVAIVTGAGQGIGEGIVLALANEGCKVVVSDINSANAARVSKKIGRGSIAVKCDVSKKQEVDSLISAAVKKFKKIDILVNNAGIYPFRPFLEMSEQDWDRVIAVNLKSVFLCTQAAAKVMKSRKSGSIVNISSIAGIVGYPALPHYCASKAGILGFTRSVAVELAPFNIRVNAILPGPIKTPGIGAVDAKTMQQMLQKVPLKRIGVPEDIANAVVFLASDKSGYITGQSIVVDGGWTASS